MILNLYNLVLAGSIILQILWGYLEKIRKEEVVLNPGLSRKWPAAIQLKKIGLVQIANPMSCVGRSLSSGATSWAKTTGS